MKKKHRVRRFLLSMVIAFAVFYGALTVYALLPVHEVSPLEFASPEDRFIDIDGQQIRYVELGSEGNPVMVMVHGFGGSSYTFRKLMPLLDQDYHIFALDLPGFGLSTKSPDYDYSYENQGKTVSAFIESLGLEEVVLVGHSMGGNIVLNAGIVNDRVAGLGLLEPGLIDDGNPEFLKYLFFPLTRISAKLFRSEDFRMSSFRSSYADPSQITQADVDAIMVASRTEGFVDSLTAMLSTYADPTEMAIAPDFDRPVLLLWGDRDEKGLAEEAPQMLEAFADVRLELITGSGHYVHEEQPQQSARALRTFAQSL